jgi:hypothetical protein
VPKKIKLIEDSDKISVLDVDLFVQLQGFLPHHMQKVLSKEDKTNRRQLQNICPGGGFRYPALRPSTESPVVMKTKLMEDNCNIPVRPTSHAESPVIKKK